MRCSTESTTMLCDLGAGRTVLGAYLHKTRRPHGLLHIVDQSEAMLSWSRAIAPPPSVFYLLDAEQLDTLGVRFDLIVASLGDPFNTIEMWRAVRRSLAPGGRFLFTTPSFAWAHSFRAANIDELPSAALFELADGSRHYVPSFVYPPEQQTEIIASAGLEVTGITDFTANELLIPPPKIAALAPEAAIVSLFDVRNPEN